MHHGTIKQKKVPEVSKVCKKFQNLSKSLARPPVLQACSDKSRSQLLLRNSPDVKTCVESEGEGGKNVPKFTT